MNFSSFLFQLVPDSISAKEEVIYNQTSPQTVTIFLLYKVLSFCLSRCDEHLHTVLSRSNKEKSVHVLKSCAGFFSFLIMLAVISVLVFSISVIDYYYYYADQEDNYL